MVTVTNNLKGLHELHLKMEVVQKKLEEGPRQISIRQKIIARREAEAHNFKEQILKMKMTGDEKNLRLKSNESKILELKAKLNAASSNKEFQIIKSQIEADEMANSVLEDEILEAFDKIDTLQEKINENQESTKKAVEQKKQVEADVKATEPGLRQEEDELQKLISDCESVVITASLGDMYRRLVKKHGAGALAVVENKACTSCYDMQSANTMVELNMNKTILCKTCGRILYKDEE